ncbi:hypothetical protein D3D03_12100 [Exiguobacterium sp. RIT452]|uniref:hypothetical protein n=1 Tax=Exiguobacterium sp. RIT452 TaxID=2315552 RepID=UPI000E764BEE|nr:hypothetical protein [Exiguobacterium sp. RIT452]RJO97507.1 hypothetical protein D3D03_12100 [Exiguobacterium sp. RIT452]
MKKIILVLLCIGIGLSSGSLFVLKQEKPPEEEGWKDGRVVVRHVGTSVSNTAAIQELIKQLPFSDALDNVSIDGSSVQVSYRVTGQERIDWTGVNTENITRDSQSFSESRLSKLIMHHTLALFLSISDLMELEIQYSDPFTRIVFSVDRPRIEAYTPQDIDRATSSSDRFNRVVVEDYILVDSRRLVFLEKFADSLKIIPEK